MAFTRGNFCHHEKLEICWRRKKWDRIIPVINPIFTTFHILEAVRERRGDQLGTRGHTGSIQAQGTHIS